MVKPWPTNTFKKQASHKPHKNKPGNVTISPCQTLQMLIWSMYRAKSLCSLKPKTGRTGGMTDLKVLKNPRNVSLKEAWVLGLPLRWPGTSKAFGYWGWPAISQLLKCHLSPSWWAHTTLNIVFNVTNSLGLAQYYTKYDSVIFSMIFVFSVTNSDCLAQY